MELHSGTGLFDGFIGIMIAMVLPVIAHPIYVIGRNGKAVLGLAGLVPIAGLWMVAAVLAARSPLAGSMTSIGFPILMSAMGLLLWAGMARLAMRLSRSINIALQLLFGAAFLIFFYLFWTAQMATGGAA